MLAQINEFTIELNNISPNPILYRFSKQLSLHKIIGKASCRPIDFSFIKFY